MSGVEEAPPEWILNLYSSKENRLPRLPWSNSGLEVALQAPGFSPGVFDRTLYEE